MNKPYALKRRKKHYSNDRFFSKALWLAFMNSSRVDIRDLGCTFFLRMNLDSSSATVVPPLVITLIVFRCLQHSDLYLTHMHTYTKVQALLLLSSQTQGERWG